MSDLCAFSPPSQRAQPGSPDTVGGEPWGCLRQQHEQETNGHSTKSLRFGVCYCVKGYPMLTNTDRNLDCGKGGVLSQWGKIIIPKKVGQLFIIEGQKRQNPCSLITLKCILDRVTYKK